MKKFDNIFLYSAVIIPWAAAIGLSVFYLHATYIIGTFPTYAKPDPKDLSIYSFYGPIVYSFWIVLLLTFMPYLVAVIILIIEGLAKKYLVPILLAVLGEIVCLCITQTTMFDWFSD